MAESYDAVVIGAGHNGLVTAAYLARSGKRVLVVERRESLGGIAVTEEFAPGFRASVGPDLCGILLPQVVRDLELKRHGLEIHRIDPMVFVPSADGGHLLLWQDKDKTLQEIARHSTADAEAYPRFAQLIDRLATFARPLLSRSVPLPGAQKTGELLDWLGIGWNLRRLGHPTFHQALRVPSLCIADFLDEWFTSDLLKAVLAAPGLVGVHMGPRSFGTASIFLYHQLGEPGWPLTGWGLPKGGMGAVSRAMAEAAETHGTRFRTGASVCRIRVREGHVQGVVLESGEEIDARLVVSNADPRTTFLKLLEPHHLETELLNKVRRIRYRGVTAKLLLAMGELPDFSCLPGNQAAAHHRGVIQIGSTLDELQRAFDDAKYRRPSARPFLQVVIPSLADPALAPEGRHVVSVTMQYAPYTLEEGDWSACKEELADRIIERLAEVAPNFRGAVLHRKIFTPLDYEQIYGLPEGSFHHAEMSLDQLFFMRPMAGWARYHTPIRGLYLCGSSTHPGGGITGACGYNASREILKD